MAYMIAGIALAAVGLGMVPATLWIVRHEVREVAAGFNRTLDGTWRTVHRLDNKLEALAEAVEGCDEKLKWAKMSLLRLNAKIETLPEDFGDRMDALEVSVSVLDGRVKALAKAVAQGGGWLLETKATVSGLEAGMEKLSETVEGRGEGADEIPEALRSLDDRGKFLAEGIERCSGKLNTVLEVALRADDRIHGVSADMGRDLKELRDGVRSLEDQGKGFSEAAEALKEPALTVEELRRGVEILMERGKAIDHRLERMEKLMADRGAADQGGSDDHIGPADASLPAERESELSREMEEGVMNLLRYAAGKAPGVEVSI